MPNQAFSTLRSLCFGAFSGGVAGFLLIPAARIAANIHKNAPLGPEAASNDPAFFALAFAVGCAVGLPIAIVSLMRNPPNPAYAFGRAAIFTIAGGYMDAILFGELFVGALAGVAYAIWTQPVKGDLPKT